MKSSKINYLRERWPWRCDSGHVSSPEEQKKSWESLTDEERRLWMTPWDELVKLNASDGGDGSEDASE